MSAQIFIFFGSLYGFLSVALGAFAAHGLKNKFAADMLTVFETGARYQMYHALALLLVGFLSLQIKNSWLAASGYAFILGTFIFSGSLYILVLSGVKAWGAVTPIGGLCFLAGWTLLAISAFRL